MRFREGAGRLCLDYLRTLRHGALEELSDAEALAAWIEQFSVVECVTTLAEVPRLCSPKFPTRERSRL